MNIFTLSWIFVIAQLFGCKDLKTADIFACTQSIQTKYGILLFCNTINFKGREYILSYVEGCHFVTVIELSNVNVKNRIAFYWVENKKKFMFISYNRLGYFHSYEFTESALY